MKVYIVLAGRSDIPYRGSWYGCLDYCKDTETPLRIAVMRAGNPAGHVVAEATSEGFRPAENKTSVSARWFADG